MYKVLILLLVILPFQSFSTTIEIVADVNGTPISNLDLDKRMKLVTSLFGSSHKKQVLEELINEIIIESEAAKLKLQLQDKELSDAVRLYFTYNFGLKSEEVDRYIKEHNIDLNALAKKIKCELLLHKIIEMMHFVGKISDAELENVKKQIEKPYYLVSLQEMIIPKGEHKDDLARKWRDNGNFVPNLPVKIRQNVVSLSRLTDILKDILEKLDIGDVTDPIDMNKDHYSVMKIVDKVKIDHKLLNSTLNLKQVTIQDSAIDLEKVSCANFNKIVKPAEVKEFSIKMRNLNPNLQIAFSKGTINELAQIKNNNKIKLVILCGVENNPVDIGKLKSLMYGQKSMVQSNILLDNMRKNAVINYRKANVKVQFTW